MKMGKKTMVVVAAFALAAAIALVGCGSSGASSASSSDASTSASAASESASAESASAESASAESASAESAEAESASAESAEASSESAASEEAASEESQPTIGSPLTEDDVNNIVANQGLGEVIAMEQGEGADGVWYWEVTTRDANGNEREWSIDPNGNVSEI
ncbi:MAG: PepSY domain-containing protein [Eggerthellaceae bacterium]|nr:PepSY domain-containing protein [Eggerthellaceae bacterium]